MEAVSRKGSDKRSLFVRRSHNGRRAGKPPLLFEDEAVRVLEVTVAPGERENLHHHRWPSIMVVLARPNYRNFDADGNEIPPSGGTPASPVLPRALRLPHRDCMQSRSRLMRRMASEAFGLSSRRPRRKGLLGIPHTAFCEILGAHARLGS